MGRLHRPEDRRHDRPPLLAVRGRLPRSATRRDLHQDRGGGTRNCATCQPTYSEHGGSEEMLTKRYGLPLCELRMEYRLMLYATRTCRAASVEMRSPTCSIRPASMCGTTTHPVSRRRPRAPACSGRDRHYRLLGLIEITLHSTRESTHSTIWRPMPPTLMCRQMHTIHMIVKPRAKQHWQASSEPSLHDVAYGEVDLTVAYGL